MKSWNVCTTKEHVTQNRFRNVRHGDSSEYIDAQLSKIEDRGEKEYRSETTITKF